MFSFYDGQLGLCLPKIHRPRTNLKAEMFF